MATFQIIEDGFITEPYQSRYGFQNIPGQNTLRQINGDKYGLIVKLSADGKPDLAFYHEIENIDPETGYWEGDGFPSEDIINRTLQLLANSYA